ncbi:MAG: hypothetical protein GY829_08605 [Gammaproteobacteria bacterium]|nr:hypothetical protein [Gammaproteobacteria bacterium]
MKLNAIINAQPMLGQLTTLALPIEATIGVLALCRDTAIYVEAFQKRQKMLFEKYGEKDPNDSTRHIIKSKYDEVFQKEITKILNAECKLKFDKIRISDLQDAGVKMNAHEVRTIEWFLI